MHGVKRTKDDATAKAKTTEKIKQYQGLLQQINERKAGKQHDRSTLEICSRLVTVNPESYTTWNFRRNTLLDMFEGVEGSTMEEPAIKKLLEKELALVEQCVRRNPKSYWVWNQRVWATEQLQQRGGGCDWSRELALTEQMLKWDARNFHCWCYRRFVTSKLAAVMGQEGDLVLAKDELEFARKKIEENFSNYSAWHHRSKLLPVVFVDKEALRTALDDEFKFVQNAFFTEPSDQSAWIYHQWLVATYPGTPDQRHLMLQREVKRVDEVLQLADSTEERKWPRIATVRLLQALNGPEMAERISCLLHDLEQEDPRHAGYYRDQRAKATCD